MRFFLIFMMLAGLTQAAEPDETIVADLSQNRVAITANFDGSRIFIFGAVKRDMPPPTDFPLEVVIAVSGPLLPVTVRRKEWQFGIWINKDSVEVDAAPSFYTVASSRPLDEVLTNTEDLRYKISLERMIRSVGAPQGIEDAASFTEAVVRIREANGLYSEARDRIRVTEETLFQTEISLPSNLVEGDYIARIFLTRNKQVVDSFETSITVRKVGLERWIYNLAYEKPLVYGLLSLFIAISAGWLASAVFRVLRI
jgi:uncharacterized protein (TIGR02186 family)